MLKLETAGTTLRWIFRVLGDSALVLWDCFGPGVYSVLRESGRVFCCFRSGYAVFVQFAPQGVVADS
jgi:hypothetical protein